MKPYLVLAAIALAACSPGDGRPAGNEESKTYAIEGFDSVSAETGIVLILKQGPFSISAQSQRGDLSRLHVDLRGSELNVSADSMLTMGIQPTYTVTLTGLKFYGPHGVAHAERERGGLLARHAVRRRDDDLRSQQRRAARDPRRIGTIADGRVGRRAGRAAELPQSQIRLAHSLGVGGIEGAACDWAVVFVPNRPYAIALMTNFIGDGADDAMAKISKLAYDYFARLARSSEFGARVPLELLPKKQN